MTANTRPLCHSTGSVELHLLCCFSHLAKSYLPPFIAIVWPFRESLIPFLPQSYSAGEARETIISHSVLLFMWTGGLFRNVTGVPLLQLLAACFQDLDCSCNYFGRSILWRELHNWWPVFLLWVFNQYLWVFLGERERLNRAGSPSTDSSSSAIFLVPLQPFSAEMSTLRCNTSVLCGSWLMWSVLIVNQQDDFWSFYFSSIVIA